MINPDFIYPGFIDEVKGAKRLPAALQFGTMETYLLPETTVDMVENEGMMVNAITLSDALKEGQVYTVTVDGSEYKSTCVFAEEIGFCVIGNMAAFGGDDTGEPFAVMDTGVQTVFISLQGASSVVVSIRGVADVPLSSRYAPEPVFVDLVELGAGEIGVGKFTEVQVETEPFIKAFKNGFIKMRIPVSAPLRTVISNSMHSLEDVQGAVEFVAPVKMFDGDFIVETTLFDAAIFVKVQPDGTLWACLFKMAIYNKQGNLLPAVSN